MFFLLEGRTLEVPKGEFVLGAPSAASLRCPPNEALRFSGVHRRPSGSFSRPHRRRSHAAKCQYALDTTAQSGFEGCLFFSRVRQGRAAVAGCCLAQYAYVTLKKQIIASLRARRVRLRRADGATGGGFCSGASTPESERN